MAIRLKPYIYIYIYIYILVGVTHMLLGKRTVFGPILSKLTSMDDKAAFNSSNNTCSKVIN